MWYDTKDRLLRLCPSVDGRLEPCTVQAVLRQDISWYDTTTTTDFASRMTDDLNKLEDGIGEKIGMLLHFLGIFLISHIGKTIYSIVETNDRFPI
jgi:hypothetical protein